MTRKSHTPRKPFQPRRKATPQEAMLQAMQQIKAACPEAMHVTILARHPTNRDAEILISDDDMDQVFGTLSRRREAYDLSRQNGECVT